MLNVRVEGWKSPVRIVCDSKLRIRPDSQIVKSAEKYRTIVAYADQKNTEEKIKILHTMGVETIYCPDEKKQIDLKKLMTDLGNRGIDSILLEGGGTLNDSALRAGIVKEEMCIRDRFLTILKRRTEERDFFLWDVWIKIQKVFF